MALALGTNSGFVSAAPSADPEGADVVTIDGNSVVTKHTSPANAIKITEIGWYRGIGTNGANFEVGLYSDNAGVADVRLHVAATNSSTSGGWITVAVDWSISASTDYWLALQMDAHGGSSVVDGQNTDGAGSDSLTAQTTLNDPYGGGAVTHAAGMYAIYGLVAFAKARMTRLGLSATPRGLYGTFAGKTADGGGSIVPLLEGGMLRGGMQQMTGGL